MDNKDSLRFFLVVLVSSVLVGFFCLRQKISPLFKEKNYVKKLLVTVTVPPTFLLQVDVFRYLIIFLRQQKITRSIISLNRQWCAGENFNGKASARYVRCAMRARRFFCPNRQCNKLLQQPSRFCQVFFYKYCISHLS